MISPPGTAGKFMAANHSRDDIRRYLNKQQKRKTEHGHSLGFWSQDAYSGRSSPANASVGWPATDGNYPVN